MLAKTTQTDDERVAEYDKRAIERRNAAKVLGKFEIDKCNPLSNGREGVDQILRQVHGLCTVLENAHIDADTLDRSRRKDAGGCEENSPMHSSYPIFMARAFEAIGTLTALAIFFGEAE